MARKLEDILKAQGYTDADLTAAEPLLKDPRFRQSIEAGVEAIAAEERKDELGKWQKWHAETALPALDAAMKREQDARKELAAQKAYIQTLEEQGLITASESEAARKKADEEAAAKKAAEFNPKDHKLVTSDDLDSRVVQFAELEGDAIALAQDIAAEHQRLFGTHLPSFRELRREALAAKQPVEQYWQTKFKVQDKRAELDAKAKKDWEDKIRKEERDKVLSEQLNPMTRTPSISRASFTRPPEGAGQPWAKSPEELAAQRVQKGFKALVDKGLVQ